MILSHRLLGQASELELLGQKYNTGKTHYGYLTHFEYYFSQIRDQAISILELGILDGASLKVWEDYFPRATIIGVDINDKCKQFVTPRTNVIIGDLNRATTINQITTLAPFDIIIDDAGHTMTQQPALFKNLFPFLKDGGIYIIEDLHTSYWETFKGGLDVKETTVNFLVDLINHLNHRAYKKNLFDQTGKVHCDKYTDQLPDSFDESIYSVHFYRSMCAILKGKTDA